MLEIASKSATKHIRQQHSTDWHRKHSRRACKACTTCGASAHRAGGWQQQQQIVTPQQDPFDELAYEARAWLLKVALPACLPLVCCVPVLNEQ